MEDFSSRLEPLFNSAHRAVIPNPCVHIFVVFVYRGHVFLRYFAYSVGSRRWEDLGTSRGTWRRTQCSACPGERCPTAVPHTRSSKWVSWLSTPRSYVGWCRRWGIWELGGSSCRHELSMRAQRRRVLWRAGRKTWVDFAKRGLTSSSLCRVLDVRADVMPAFLEFWTKDWREQEKAGQSLSVPAPISFSLVKNQKLPLRQCVWASYCMLSRIVNATYRWRCTFRSLRVNDLLVKKKRKKRKGKKDECYSP